MGCFSFKGMNAALAVACGLGLSYGITPNKLVSGGLPAYTGATTTDYLTDGYLTNWKSSNAKEIALNVGEGPKKLLINWESFGDCAWATDFTSGCGHTGVALSNFKILTSANSTDGSDGDWTEAASIVNNPVMARGVEIDFAGKSWFKFVSMGLLLIVFGIVAYRNFLGHCNNIIRQIDAIEGRPTTKKNMTFWYFMGSLTALIVVGLLIFYQLLKPTVYTRAENDMNTAGTLEFKVLDVDTMVFDNDGKPIINTISFNYRKKGESTPIIVQMTPEADQEWYQFTSKAKSHIIGLFLDGELVQKYYIQNAIDNGHFYLNTNPDWSKKEVEDFCKRLIKN